MSNDTTDYEAKHSELLIRMQQKWAARYKHHSKLCDPNDPVCSTCIAEYIKNPRAQTRFGTALVPECDLSTLWQLQTDKKEPWWATLTDEQKANYQVAKDPVYWAAARLRSLRDTDKHWAPAWYQIEPLRCSSRKLLLLWGRQLGKCVLGTCRISTYDGRQVPVADLEGKEFDVLSMSETKIVPRRAIVTKNIMKPCVRVRFTSGRELGVSVDHPFKAFDRWIDAAELKPGDRIASVGKGVFGRQTMPDEEIEALAFAIAEGGLMGKNSRQKFVPPEVQMLPRPKLALFLNRLFACDGWASVSKRRQVQIGYCSASRALATGVQELLLKFGIFSIVYEKHPKLDGKDFTAWQLLIACGEAIRKFASEIDILSKEGAVRNVVDHIRPPTNNERSVAATLPKEARALAVAALRGRSEHGLCPDIRIKRERGLSRRVALVLADRLDASDLRAWANSEEIIWDEVASVEDIGDHQTYSVSILGADNYDEQNFSAEGIFTHNTESLAVKILFRMDTRKNYKIVVVCPYHKQINEIYTRLLNLIRSSPQLSLRLRRCRENPNEIMFDNGSYVRLFTAGVQTGKGGADVRGQPADWLVFDEADYLDDATIVASLATLTSAKDPELFVSSTPTGKRGKFYEWATDPTHGFRVLHATSMEGPAWREENELFLRKTYSRAFFAHEYEAQFGEMEAGVFRRQYLDSPDIILDYDVDNPTPDHKSYIYSMGIDWNSKGVGGVFVVIGYGINPKDKTSFHKFKLVYREIVDPEQFTQLHSVRATVNLARVWDPRYIYVDFGFGECVHPDTMITCQDGTRPIRAVSVGDSVLTHGGVYKRVIGKVVRSDCKVSYEVKPAKCLRTVVAETHPYLAFRMDGPFRSGMSINEKDLVWTRSTDLSPGDLIAIPKLKAPAHRAPNTIDVAKFSPDSLCDGAWVWYPTGFSEKRVGPKVNDLVVASGFSKPTITRMNARLRKNEKLTRGMRKAHERILRLYPNYRPAEPKRYPRWIDPFRPEVLRLLGWFLSEGWAGDNAIEFSQATSKSDALFSMEEDFLAVFGERLTREDKPDGMSRLYCSSKIIANLFAGLGGKGHANKKFHTMYMSHWDKLTPALQTLFLGDGHKNALGWEISLTSATLIDQTRLILLSHGLLPNQYYSDTRGPNTKPQWALHLSGDSEWCAKAEEVIGLPFPHHEKVNRRNYIDTGSFLLVPLRTMRNVGPVSGLIDIEVEGDESFVGNGVLLHNTQVELLHKHGMNNPESKLHKIVKGIPMHSNIEIRDPVTKRMVKRQAKNLLVELCVARLEQGQIVLPKSEDNSHGLVGQMREYQVERTARNNKKVYTGENDHLVTAWLLAVGGLILEESDIKRAEQISDIVLMDNNLNRILKKVAKPAPLRGGVLKQSPRVGARALSVEETLRYAQTGLPDNHRLKRGPGRSPLGRNKWR